jgi:hypothetical protein
MNIFFKTDNKKKLATLDKFNSATWVNLAEPNEDEIEEVEETFKNSIYSIESETPIEEMKSISIESIAVANRIKELVSGEFEIFDKNEYNLNCFQLAHSMPFSLINQNIIQLLHEMQKVIFNNDFEVLFSLHFHIVYRKICHHFHSQYKSDNK